MTAHKPMTTKDMPGTAQPADPSHAAQAHRVKVGGHDMTLDEARAAMSPALAHQLAQQYPRASETPELAQQLVDAYAAAHEQQNGEKWSPGRAPKGSERPQHRG